VERHIGVTKLHELHQLGQSIWLDYIRRSLLTSGGLKTRIDQGVRGMTSNPTIFDKAIANSDDYDDQFTRLVQQDKSDREIYESLAIDDIQRAADQFRPVYEERKSFDGTAQNYGSDGFVSLEANPHLANDTLGTIEEIRRLHRLVDRPNVMFKVPATPAGIPAIKQLTADGININITLMFSSKHYNRVSDAWLAGLEDRAQRGDPVMGIASVASFFVSRMDSKLDPRLDEMGLKSLRGTIGIANAKHVYQQFTQVFSSARWYRLVEQGAQVQRVLWGSTSTKDPAYPDTMYVDDLIGPQTVNTVPPETLDDFLDHGTVERTVDQKLTDSRMQLEQLAKAGIDIITVGDELQEEGVVKFTNSFDDLMESIARKRKTIETDARMLDMHAD
jgi:transaldolase